MRFGLLTRAWLKAYDTRDVDKSVAFLDEQGSMLPPNTHFVTGKKATAELIAPDFVRVLALLNCNFVSEDDAPLHKLNGPLLPSLSSQPAKLGFA